MLGSLYIASADQNGDIRLVNGETENCGRVEVFYDGEWGTVCDDKWGVVDGDAACRQLGYESAANVYWSAYFGKGVGPIWLDNLRCRSQDNLLSECRHNGWGKHNCKHREDAGVCCERTQAPKPLSLPVRLYCPECGSEWMLCKTCPDKPHPEPTDCSDQFAVKGIVEVEVDGVWGPVSTEGWDEKEALVVCGELGYPISFPQGASPPVLADIYSPPDSLVDEGSGIIHSAPVSDSVECNPVAYHKNTTVLQGVECIGKEARLLDCYFSGIGLVEIPSSSAVAAVQCGYLPHPDCNSTSDKVDTF